MIWFILIYVITLILFCVLCYLDMDKGETLEHYFQGMDIILFIVAFLFPIFNTLLLIMLILSTLSKTIWDKIKYWKK